MPSQPTKTSCDKPKPKDYGMYDPNCDDKVQPPGLPIPKSMSIGAIVGVSVKSDGRKCMQFGLFGSLPLVPSIDLGNLSE